MPYINVLTEKLKGEYGNIKKNKGFFCLNKKMWENLHIRKAGQVIFAHIIIGGGYSYPRTPLLLAIPPLQGMVRRWIEYSRPENVKKLKARQVIQEYLYDRSIYFKIPGQLRFICEIKIIIIKQFYTACKISAYYWLIKKYI